MEFVDACSSTENRERNGIESPRTVNATALNRRSVIRYLLDNEERAAKLVQGRCAEGMMSTLPMLFCRGDDGFGSRTFKL